MTKTAQGTLWVCQDCYVSRETGETPENLEFEPWTKLRGYDLTAGVVDHEEWCTYHDGNNECDCAHTDFNWSECDACESTLAGEKHAYTWWANED